MPLARSTEAKASQYFTADVLLHFLSAKSSRFSQSKRLEVAIQPIHIQFKPKCQQPPLADCGDIHETQMLFFDIGNLSPARIPILLGPGVQHLSYEFRDCEFKTEKLRRISSNPRRLERLDLLVVANPNLATNSCLFSNELRRNLSPRNQMNGIYSLDHPVVGSTKLANGRY